MSTEVRNLEPKPLWNHFADLNEVPRPSKKEERVIQFAKAFGEKLGLDTHVDEAGNVIIRKPATPGMENRLPVVLQSHLDMVHQKNNDTQFDFSTEGIKMYVDKDWVRAKGTTLGADNGLGVASIMTILESDDIPHPPLEALFTIDEETGMTGAKALKGGVLNGKILLNLDTEDDDELTIGCAGGIDVTATAKLATESAPGSGKSYTLKVKGLKGGHSGMEIHLGRGNANKLMNRLLWQTTKEFGVSVASIDGGGLRNAIPRESTSIVTVDESNAADFEKAMQKWGKDIKAEYKTTDPDTQVVCESTDRPEMVLTKDAQQQLINAIYSCPNGIYRMSPDIDGLVQTSNNVAHVEVKDGNCSIQCLTRSSVETEKMDLAHAIQATFEQMGATVELAGDYPGWQPDPHASIVEIMENTYTDLFNEKPHVLACHAGLECGILGSHYPDMEMISFGPTIKGAHSPDERANIPSVKKFWKLLLETLEKIPAAN